MIVANMIVADQGGPVIATPSPGDRLAAPPSRDRLVATACLVAGAALTIAFGRVHPDGLIHFDDLTHYLIAQWAWTWPSYLLNDWGRPGFTVVYFLPAGLGWAACRVLSAALHAAAAWLAYRSAGRLGLRRAWLVVPLCYVQPLFFNLAQTTLTETPMAFYLMAAVYLGLSGRWGWSAAALSLTFVTRHEAIMLAPAWCWFAWRAGVAIGRWWPLVWAPVAVNGLAAACGMTPAAALLLSPSATTQYGQGGWLTFLCRSMESAGPGVVVLAMAGLGVLCRQRAGRFAMSLAIVYFLGHTAVRALGLYGSGGYARFLAPIAPLVAVSALAGWNRFFESDVAERRRAAWVVAAGMVMLWASMERQIEIQSRFHDIFAEVPRIHHARLAVRWATVILVCACAMAAVSPRRRRLAAAPAILSAALMALAARELIGPLRPPPEAAIIRDSLAHLADRGLGGRPIISANVWIDHVTGARLPPDRPSVRQRLAIAPPGTLFAWEAQFAGSEDHGLPLDEFFDSPAWDLVHTSAPRPPSATPYLFFFVKTVDAPRPAAAAPVARLPPLD